MILEQRILILEKEIKYETVGSLQSWRRKQGIKKGTNRHSNQWDQSLFVDTKGTLRICVDWGFVHGLSHVLLPHPKWHVL